MKIQTKIGYGKITVSHPMINDTYHIEEMEESGEFYIWSDNGYNTWDCIEFKDLEKAVKHAKKLVKNYFADRGEDNPKGF